MCILTSNIHLKDKIKYIKMRLRPASFQCYIPNPSLPRVFEDISVEDVEKRRAPMKHYVYVVYVAWCSGTVSVVHRTYQDFQRLHSQLQEKFNKDPEFSANGKIIPDLQGRVILGRNNVHKVALWRLQILHEFCKVLNSLPPKVSSTPGVVRFFQPTDLDVKTFCHDKERMNNDQNGQQGASEISNPLLSERYVALADYVKNGADELSLTAGDSLEVFIRNESGWWLVCKDKCYGWVPYSYMEKVEGCEDLPQSQVTPGKAERYLALREFDPTEPDEVALQKGQVVEVLEKYMDGWWKVRYANQEGMAPAVNLAKADSRKARRALEKAAIPQDEPESEELNPRLSLFENPNTDSGSDSDMDDFVDTVDIKAMGEKVKATMKLQQAPSENKEMIKNLRKRAPLPPPRKSSVKRTNIGSPWTKEQNKSPTIDEETQRTRNDSGSDDEYADPSEMRSAFYKNIVVGNPVDTHIDPSDNNEYYNVSPFNHKESTKGRPQYQSRAAFKGGDAGETDLYEDEIVLVLEKTGTGWWLVQSSTGVGWVPSHYLRLPKENTTGPTAADVPGDVHEETAPQKYTPRLPEASKRESMKQEGHIAYRYLKSTLDGPKSQTGCNSDAPSSAELAKNFSEEVQLTEPAQTSTKPLETTQKSTETTTKKPQVKPKPCVVVTKSPTSPTNLNNTNVRSSSPTAVTKSSSKPAPVPPKKPITTGSGVKTPWGIQMKDQSHGSTIGSDSGGVKSVKDLKAIFNRS